MNAPAQPRLRILHVEDNAADAELIHRLLRQEWPHCEMTRVETRPDFEAALHLGGFDLILSDFSLPTFDGMTALDVVRQLKTETPFIFMSGTIGEDRAVEALQRGALDYVLKDRPVRLVPAIRRALEQQEQQRRRHEAEARLVETERMLAELAERSSEVFWSMAINPERTLFVSPAFATVWGLPVDALHAEPLKWIEAIHPEDRERIRATFRSLLDGHATGYDEEYRVIQPDGSVRWVVDGRLLILGGGGERLRVSGTVRDVTAHRMLEKQYLQAQRLESIGTLAGGIAHDLNNVLTPIMMAVALLERKVVEPELLRLLAILSKSTEHGAQLIKQVLAFARGTGGVREAVDLGKVIGEVVALLRQTLPRTITLETEVAPDLVPLSADATQLGQILMNLGVNARDAMPEGGRLTIRARQCEVAAALAASHPGARPGPHVLLEVEDSGTGIPAEILDRIFDPFFTTKEAGKGTGLGLATVIGILKGHHGFLQVQSEVGRGTRFALYFPIGIAQRRRIGELATAAPRSGRGETILLLEDETGVREVARALLQASGYQVVWAEDGSKGLACFHEHGGRIDAVVTDLTMPGMTGGAVVRQLRALRPGLPIVVMSGQAKELDRLDAEMRGLFLLPKPMTGNALLRALATVLPGPPPSGVTAP